MCSTGACLIFSGCAAAPPSRVKITWPTFTFSPSLTLMSLTVPVTEDGTSTTALSVSSSMTGWPSVTLAPSETINRTRSPWSMFSPSSGSLNSVTRYSLLPFQCGRGRLARVLRPSRCRTSEGARAYTPSYRRRLAGATYLSICRIRFFRIDSQIFHCLLQHVELDLLFAEQRGQSGQHNMFRVHLEEIPQRGPALAAAETIRT